MEHSKGLISMKYIRNRQYKTFWILYILAVDYNACLN
jgi:hypothetical protein